MEAGHAGWNLTGNRFGFGLPAIAETRQIHFSGVASAGADLIYTLWTDTVGGLFEYQTGDGFERRLYHRNQFRAGDVQRHPGSGRLAMSLAADAGTVRLGITEPDGRKLRTVTEGDAIDQAPSWVEGQPETLVYQSAGIGRNASGFYAGQSSFAIYRLDLTTGNNDELLVDERHDLLLPRQRADGTLYYIRRPFQGVPRASPWRLLRDILLFPIGVVLAIVHFLNFFSLMFRQKPLITSGGPPSHGQDPKFLMLYGRVIQADKLLRKRVDTSPLVPADWQLIRRSPGGAETVLAKGVGSYDFVQDGEGIVYTDGSGIWLLEPSAPALRIGTGRLIERVITVAAATP
ncbi:MAG: hypothetical protein QM754_01250 [Tepidisphaeraceae bacterium]